MTPTEAKNILAAHNAWRRGDEGIEQLSGKLVGEAIDSVLAHINTQTPALTVDALAQEIGRIKGGAEPDAVGFAKTLLIFINRHIAAAQQGAGDVDSSKQMADQLLAWARHPLNGLTPMRIMYLEAFADRIRRLATRSPQPAKPAAYDIELIANMLESMNTTGPYTRTAINEQIEHLRAAENADASGVHTTSQPAGAAPLPVLEVLERREVTPLCDHVVMGYTSAQLQVYGDAREAAGYSDGYAEALIDTIRSEAAGRADAVPEGYALFPSRELTDAEIDAFADHFGWCGEDKAHPEEREEVRRQWQAFVGIMASPQQMTTQGEGAGREAVVRNPLQAYADSYRMMARMGDGKVDCLSVAIDIENNMSKHAGSQP